MNVTLREVAAELGKSYGNITYHYSTKETLLRELFDDMNKELIVLQETSPSCSWLEYFLSLPDISFDITKHYLFFLLDLQEIRRNYPDFFGQIGRLNEERMANWYQLLNQMNKEGTLRKELNADDLYYLMFLSGSVRSAYFQTTPADLLDKKAYTEKVNRLLRPYLSKKGKAIFNHYC